jgi:ureidoglycolate lyase
MGLSEYSGSSGYLGIFKRPKIFAAHRHREMFNVPITPLTKSTFSPFGEVVEIEDATAVDINQGFAERWNDLAHIDVASANGEMQVCLFSARPRPAPIVVKLMERHPLSSQLFYPLQDKPWLVLVP